MNKVLYAVRTVKGISTAELAAKLKTDEVTYKEIESGAREMPLNTSQLLANLFDLPFDYFIHHQTVSNAAVLKVVDDVNACLSEVSLTGLPAETAVSVIALGLKASSCRKS